jgi:hypothetical protein
MLTTYIISDASVGVKLFTFLVLITQFGCDVTKAILLMFKRLPIPGLEPGYPA